MSAGIAAVPLGQENGEHTTTLPTDLNTLFKALLAEQRETNRLLRNERKDWLTGDEAAALLGRPYSKSGQHLRILKFARDKGHLTIFGSRSPFTYWRKEVEALQQKVVRNEVYLS